MASGLFSGRAMNVFPVGKRVFFASLSDERSVDQSFGDDHVRERVDDGDVGSWPQLKVLLRLDVRRPHEVDATRIDDDQFCAFSEALLHTRCEDGVRRQLGWRRSAG